MGTRLLALIVKEFLALLRDPKSRFILIGPPVIQLFVFSYAATLEVTNFNVGVLDRDAGRWSRELVERIAAAPAVGRVEVLASPEAVREAIDRQRVIAAVEIDQTFSRDIEAGRPAAVQVVLDGRRSNAAQIVGGYLERIVSGLAAETPAGRRLALRTVEVVPRIWFNPNLEFKWAMVPSLIGSIALILGIIVTALSIARERELGTFDQLMVSPLRTHEILIGKLVPPIVIGYVHMTLYILAAVFVFHVPLRGEIGWLYLAGFFFLAAVVGVGLFISALAATQQQAILGAFLFLVPAILLSGFATPIDNMPPWLQMVTAANPLRYFLVVVKGIFLKAIGPADVVAETIPMALIAAVTLPAAGWLFRRRLE